MSDTSVPHPFWRTSMRRLALLFLIPAALRAQTATPCPTSSILLAAKPIKGVGVTTIKNACPAFLSALERWYAGHPLASVADVVAALNGAPAVVAPPVVVPPVVSNPPVVPLGVSLAAVDFAKFSTAQLTSGAFWKGVGRDIGGISHPELITFDSSEQAMRYDWPNRSTSPCANSEITVATMPRLSPPPTGMKTLWVRFVSKESPSFSHGLRADTAGTLCGGRSYKFFLVTVERSGVLGRIGTYLGDGLNGYLSTRLYTDMNSPGFASGVKGGFSIGGDTTWGGSYHEWIVGLEGIGTDSATFSTYLDKRLVNVITGPFLSGQTLGPGWAVMFELGANINSGPSVAQSRWFRAFEVYDKKPAGIP